MNDHKLHKAQLSILHSLRYAKSERFSALMEPTGHVSDTFKFHIRKIVKQGYAEKASDGSYQLTAAGKEYANNLNEQQRAPEKQPKISVLTVIQRTRPDGQKEYLLQQRLRNPFYGYWNEIHGRVEWGESFEATAERQLKRQTGLEASFTVHSFRRVRDFDAVSKSLLEDKLFVIMKATALSGELRNTYAGGTNAWLTIGELRSKPKVFSITLDILESLDATGILMTDDITYTEGEY